MKLRKPVGPLVWMSVGLAAGLLVGVGMLVGALASRGDRMSFLPATPLHATATHGNDTFASATGFIADGMEGVYFLDYVTGELQCWVLNRRTGAWAAQFKYPSVFTDLGVEQGKTPQLLMVTGGVSFTGVVGNSRPAGSVVYVTDAKTGHFVVYGLPWNQSMAASTRPQVGLMIKVAAGSAREQVLRD